MLSPLTRSRIFDYFIAAMIGIVIADLLVPETGSFSNLALAGGVAAVVIVGISWLRGRRKERGD